jgi:ribosome-associated translation inhibitor RaiA
MTQETPTEESKINEEPIQDVPAFIVGLPDDPTTSLAESKFKKTIATLAKAYPKIDEARANVRTHVRPGSRTRYEVEVFVQIPGHRFEFVEEGWELLTVFDRISDKLKRLMTKPPERTSYRNLPSRSEFATATE